MENLKLDIFVFVEALYKLITNIIANPDKITFRAVIKLLTKIKFEIRAIILYRSIRVYLINCNAVLFLTLDMTYYPHIILKDDQRFIFFHCASSG